MKNKLGIYEKAMPENLTLKEKLQLAEKAGFDFMEISIDESEQKLNRLYLSKKEFKELKNSIMNENINIKTMCLSGHRKYPLGSLNKAVREKSIEILEKAVEFASESSISIIQLAGYDVYYENSNFDTVNYFEENLFKCVKFAAQNGIILAFETMETPFMNTIEKAMKYVKIVNSPYLQIYPDIGNITNSADNVIFDIESGKGHIAAVHLKETKEGIYRNLLFGEGRVDFDNCINEMKKQNVGMFLCEMWYDNKYQPLEFIKKAKNFFEDKI